VLDEPWELSIGEWLIYPERALFASRRVGDWLDGDWLISDWLIGVYLTI
jgi:hypothetical protein